MKLTKIFPDGISLVGQELVPGKALSLTPGEERALGAATSPRRRSQFALGRACARQALHLLGVPEPFEIGRHEGRQPVWPPGYVGSITHSHERAAAAVARINQYRSLGVDLEQVRQPSDALLHRVCRPAERDRLEALGAARLSAGFTAVFAAKESVYKAINPLTGIYLGFQDAEIVFTESTGRDTGGSPLEWRLLKDSGPEFPSGTRGAGAWQQNGEWILAGVWIPA